MSRRRSKKEIEALLKDSGNMFESGMSIYSISLEIGVGQCIIARHLRKNGYDTSRGSCLRDDPLVNYKDDIINDYLSLIIN